MHVRAVTQINLLFNHPKIRALLVKFRFLIYLAFLILLLSQIKADLLLSGFLVSLFGELIQVWCYASLDKNRTLALNGLYSVTRNPMYIGRFFLLLGGLLLIGRAWVICIFAVLYYFYAINRVKREETRLKAIFKEEYESYCSKVNRFIPSFRHSNLKSLGYFKWSLFFQNNGHWNLAGVLSVYLFFYLFTPTNAIVP